MSNIVKIESQVDVTRPEHLEALNVFLKALGTPSTITADVKIEKKETKKQTPKQEPKTGKAEEPETTGNEEDLAGPGEETSTEPEIKIEDLRAAVQAKVTAHRDTIKNKLTELGAANVTSLPKEKYADFSTFLNSLT